VGKVVWHVTMSLDGFIAGRGDAMDWASEHGNPDPLTDDVGAVLAGARSHGVGDVLGDWSGPMFVLSHHSHDDPNATFLTGHIRRAVETAKEAAGAKDLLILGANVAHQCLEQGLVDEVVVRVAPLLLGDGVRLYGGPGMPRVGLEKLEARDSGAITELRFGVVR
jgi:dihydrofolate reductase